MSTWISELDVSDSKKKLPVFIGHGEEDPMVPFQAGKAMFTNLQKSELDVTFRAYPNMGHSSCMQEMDDVKDFITNVLSGAQNVQYTLEDIKSMSAGKLKALLISKGIDVKDCLEKTDLIDKAKTNIL